MSASDLLREIANNIAYVWMAAAALAAVLVLARKPLRSAYRRWSRTTTLRLVRKHRMKLNRFHLAKRWLVKQKLLEDPAILAEVRRKMEEEDLEESTAFDLVNTYLDEIVPAFNIVSYYQWGHWAARASLRMLYEIQVSNIPSDAPSPRASQPVVYVMNHRSNADYVLVAYALLGRVSVSYAVGEWARVWPLEYLFKSFGSYFVRRGFRDPLYHRVLEAYVRELTRQAGTQGIFLEGGLSRDGELRPPKLGLLDYITSVVRDATFDGDISFVPVGINYDRVLEDRVLLRENAGDSESVSRWRQLRETLSFALKGAWRASKGRRAHFGSAAVQFGDPLSLREFMNNEPGRGLIRATFDQRRASLSHLGETLMQRIARAVPVTPVSFASTALLDRSAPLVVNDLEDYSAQLRDQFETAGALVLGPLGGEGILERGLETLMLRGLATKEGPVFRISEGAEELVRYYRNAVSQFGI